jgi:hypothetical protein
MKNLLLLLTAVVVGMTGAILFVRPDWLIAKVSEVKIQPTEISTLIRNSEETAELIRQARALAEASQFVKSIQKLDEIQPTHPSDVLTIAQLKGELSQALLRRAQDKYSQGEIREALDAGRTLPPGTGAFNEFQVLEEKWIANQTLLVAAEVFIQQNKCTSASTLLAQVTDPALQNSDRVQNLKQEIRRLLHQAETVQN